MLSRKIIIFSMIAIALLGVCGTASAYSISVYGGDTSPILTDSFKDMMAGKEPSLDLDGYLESITGVKPVVSSSSTGSVGSVSAFSNMHQQSGDENGVTSTLDIENYVSVHGTITYFSYSANFNSGML